MSGKLDQSLDQIMEDGKPAGGRRGRQTKPRSGRRVGPRTNTAAPTGGVQKSTRQNKAATTAAVKGDIKSTGSSKIIVSNLPEDVTEMQIKDYFSKSVGRTKQVLLTYGPNGRSRGVATILFADPTSAASAAKQLDGVKVDNRAMRVEVVLGAKEAPKPPPVKTLADRLSQPKNAAKENAKNNTKNNNAKSATNGASKGGRGKKSGRGGKPKVKTQEELDADMADYFHPDATAANGAMVNGSVQASAAVNGGDSGMVDEVM